MKTLEKVDKAIGLALIWGAMICFFALFAVLLGNLAIRLLALGNLMGWYTEVAEILFGWMVMFAAAVLCRNRDHFRIDLIEMAFRDKRWFYILDFATNVVALIFFAALFWYGTRLFLNAPQTMPVLGIERRWAYLCIPFNAVFLCLYTARDVMRSFRIMTGKAPIPEAAKA